MKPVQLPNFMSIGTTVIELRELNNENTHDKIQKVYLAIIETDSVNRVKYCTQFSFDMFYDLKSIKVKLT